MKTEQYYSKAMRTNRRKLFYRLYTIPWTILTIVLLSIIFYMNASNVKLKTEVIKLEQRNSELSQKSRGIIIPFDNPAAKISKEAEKAEESEKPIIDSGVRKLDTLDTEEERVQLSELYYLSEILNTNVSRKRSWEDITLDFKNIRDWGFTEDNYNYAQGMGVRIEVELIKKIGLIIKSNGNEWESNIDPGKEKDWERYERNLTYEINESILNSFRIFWESNKENK